jgi:hypothetical protein
MADNQPRYTTKRMRDEIAKAKAYARREAFEVAAKIAEFNCITMSGSEIAEEIRKAAQPAPAEHAVGDKFDRAGRDIRILLTQIDWLEEVTGEKLEDEDAALVTQIRQSWATATDATQPQHVLSITQHPNVESPNGEQSGTEPARKGDGTNNRAQD